MGPTFCAYYGLEAILIPFKCKRLVARNPTFCTGRKNSYLCIMRRWLRNVLKGASLTGALFVFQACYGTPLARQVQEDVEVVADEGETAQESVQEAAVQE